MIRNLLKKIIYSIAGVSLALNAGCSKPITTGYIYPTGNKSLKTMPYIKLYGDMKVSQPVKKVSNVPASFRNVPIHHDDYDWGQGAPIPDSSAKVVPLIDYSFLKGGLETKIGDAAIDIYGDLAFNISHFIPISHNSWLGEVNERNYQGGGLGTEHRGIGTALTYWTANYTPILIPGVKCDLSFPVAENVEMIIGGGIRDYKLQAERGWDRYNSLEKKDCLGIADITEKSIYLGFKFSNKNEFSTVFKVGQNYYDYDIREKDVVIDKENSSLFVSLGAEWPF